MRKVLSLFLIICCIFCFTACGGGEEEITSDGITSDGIGSDGIGSDGIGSDGIGSDGEEDPNKAVYVKMGFIYSGDTESRTLNNIFEIARQQVEKALGIETCYIENVLVGDFEKAVEILTEEEGCNVIVSCNNRFVNSVEKCAKLSPDTRFISYGGGSAVSNVTVLESELWQASNVCGIIAAYNSSSNILGVVADPGIYACDAVINAYILGAAEITESKTNVRVNWARPESPSEIEEAIDNLISQGCDVIMCYTGDKYAIEYCERVGVKVIGDAYNMPELAPTQYLSGFFYQFNTYLVDVARSIQYRNFSSYKNADGVKEGTVRLCAPSEENALEGTKTISDTLYDIVKTGKSDIFKGEIKDCEGNIQVAKGTTIKHKDIVEINWLEQSVRLINDYIKPVLEPASSDFEVHR